MNKIIVTITGPSGSGKSTLEGKLVGCGFSKVISTTTRVPREGEVDGIDYYFVSREKFEELVFNDGLVEMVSFKGNFYAVERAEIERVFDQGKPVVIVCEPNGAGQVANYAKRNDISLLQACVTNELHVLVERLIDRDLASVDMKYFASRLQGLIKTEIHWSTLDWDVVFNHFDESNEADVVGFILNHVDRLKEKAA